MVVVVNVNGDVHVNEADHTTIITRSSHAAHAQRTRTSHAEHRSSHAEHHEAGRTPHAHPSNTAANAAPAGSACTTKIVHFAEYAP